MTIITTYQDADPLSLSSQALNNNYPEKVVRILILNLPSWMTSVWGVVAAVLPASMREKVIIASSTSEMLQYIDPDQIPREYGGSDPTLLADSPDEHLLQEVLLAAREGRPLPPCPSPSGKGEEEGVGRQPRAPLGAGMVVDDGLLPPPFIYHLDHHHCEHRGKGGGECASVTNQAGRRGDQEKPGGPEETESTPSAQGGGMEEDSQECAPEFFQLIPEDQVKDEEEEEGCPAFPTSSAKPSPITA